MDASRLKLVYVVLLPALVVAICMLGYYTYLTAAQFERLGEESLAESSLALLKDKVGRVEQQIIRADNRAFGLVDVEAPHTLRDEWKPVAEEITPSIRALLVLNDLGDVMGYAARANPHDTRAFLRVFVKKIQPDLDLTGLRLNGLKHLHRNYDGRNYLISYKAVSVRGRRYYLAAHHDTGFLVREVFPEAFQTKPGEPLHNVVDVDNRRVFGQSLAEAGDYVVGMRFPTTLYLWRLQVAPTVAPLLEAKGRTSRFNQAALVGLSLGVILIAVAFILFAADRERRVATLKSEFIATVSHELKTPLSVIRMFGEMLLTKRVRDSQKEQEYLEIICSETERLSGLIENVLDFAALERGKRRYAMRDSDLGEIASRAIEALRYRFEREGVDVGLQLKGDPPRGRLDEQAILLVIVNLLDNALKYASEGPVEVTVETLEHELQVRVRDHGPGIPEAQRKRVFERFYRTDTSHGARGSGIGLAIVKRIAEEHRGRAWVEAAEGGGAVVAIAVPRRDPTVVTPVEPMAQAPAIDSDEAADIVARHG